MNYPCTTDLDYDPVKVLEYSLDIICIIDKQGCIVTISAAASRILGFANNELTGEKFIGFIEPRDVILTIRAVANAKKSKSSFKFENCCRHKNGAYIPFVWSVTWDDDRGIMYCMGHDGTPKKQAEMLRVSLEESNKRYDYVTKATSDAIWDWDVQRQTLYWGEGFEMIFGYDLKHELPNLESWTSHIHPEDYDRVVTSIYATLDSTEKNWKEQYRYKRANGSFAHVVDRGFVIRDGTGKALRMVGAMHDISERKKSESELKQFARELYKQNKELLQFSYIVSHNLRSPVANIMGITELLEMDKEDPEMIDRCISDLRTSGARLDGIIRDLSQILSISDGSEEITREPVDVGEVLDNITADFKERIVFAQAEINLPDTNAVLFSHKAYIYSILFNLVGNAIKYRSSRRPQINISIEEKNDTVIIKVADNGIGIDLQKHEDDLFKPYKRFDYSREGKGLGLFLVKSHVEALNGRIFIESELDHGTTFTIVLNNGLPA